MRFGLRPQAALLAAVPLLSLVLLLALAGLAVKQTEVGAAANDHLATILTQSEQLMERLTSANRSIAVYMKSKRRADLAPYDAAKVNLARQEQTLLRTVRGDPELSGRAAAYTASVEQGMEVVSRYLAALRTNDQATMRAIAASPSVRQLGLTLQKSQIDFNQAAQVQTQRTIGVRRGALRRIELWLVVGSAVGIVLTLVVSVLFGRRIVSRLQRLGDNARRLADGVPAVPVRGNDEIAELDGIYRIMADRIAASSRAHETALAELARERGAAALLQETLLPEIPSIAGLRIDTAYLTPAEGAQIGGDWFDVFVLSERSIGLSVGDVTGHGLRAAVTMGFVRQAIRVIARLDHAEPAGVMERVNRVVCEENGGIATAFFATFDRVTGVLRYALAGHGAPLVVGSDGTVGTLDGEGMLLGLDASRPFATFERALVPGEGLVLYTDGIVEVERDYLKGMRDLEAAVGAEFREPSANIAEGIQKRTFAHRPPRDDSAVLVLAVTELTPDPALEYPVWRFDAREVLVGRRVKRELLAALGALGPLQPESIIAEMVFGELLSNVVRHTPGAACVSFTVEDGHVVLSVEDYGALYSIGGLGIHTGATPEYAESGRGLFMIAALCERIRIEPTRSGKITTVVLPLAGDDAWTNSPRQDAVAY